MFAVMYRILLVALVVASVVMLSQVYDAHAQWWSGTNSSISLNGPDPMRVAVNATFTDPGASCISNGQQSTVYSDDSVDTSSVSSHSISYKCSDGPTATRTVEVYQPNRAPTMSLLTTYLTQDGSSPDPDDLGPTCTDPEDDPQHDTKISVTRSLSRSADGSSLVYDYTFTCTDSGGLTDTAHGRIVVLLFT